MLAVSIAYHKNSNLDHLKKFELMLESIAFKDNEEHIYICLDGANPSYIESTLDRFNIPIENVIYSETNIGNYALKFMLIDKIKNKYKFVKFCDFDDTSATYKKMIRICKDYEDYKLICCRTSKWSMFVNYWDKIFSTELFASIPKFKCFTGGDVIISWVSFYLCFHNNWKYALCGEMIYYKNKEASRTCREKTPEEYLRLETDSNIIKNILFYAETIESKHIYEKSSNILDIDLDALYKTVQLNDFICHLTLHYKFKKDENDKSTQ